MFYPLFLSLNDLNCLIIGFGKVGRRKFQSLIQYKPAKILILDISDKIQQDLLESCNEINIQFEARTYTKEDILNSTLVFAATNNPAENLRIAQTCKQEKVLCNSATNPDSGNFIVPAIVNNGPLTCALSTSGASPLLARLWKQELNEWLANKAQLICIMKALRPWIINNKNQPDHKSVFEKLLSIHLDEYLQLDKAEECANLIKHILPDISSDLLINIISECANAKSK